MGAQLLPILQELAVEDDVKFIGCNTDTEQFIVTTDWDIVLDNLCNRDFQNPVLTVTNAGIEITTINKLALECVHPYRLCGECKECAAIPIEDDGIAHVRCTPRRFKGRTSTLDTEEIEETLKALKLKNIAGFQWCSPLYTQDPNRISDRKRLRSWIDHDFDLVEKMWERRSRASKTKAFIDNKIKTVCSTCTLNKACTEHYCYRYQRQHVETCADHTLVTEEHREKLILDSVRNLDRESFSILSYVSGDVLPWRYDGRYKVFLKLSGDYEHTFRAELRCKTKPGRVAYRFTSLQAAVDYLRNRDTKNQLHLENNYPVTDKQLLLYKMVTDEIRYSPRHNNGWRSSSYPIRYVQRGLHADYVRVIFSNSRENDDLYWDLKVDSVYDKYRFYGSHYSY